MTYTDTELPQEDFEGLKTALRLAGYIPNKKLNREMWPKLNNELDNIKISNIDEHCFEEKLIIDDNRKRRLHKSKMKLASLMGMLTGFTSTADEIETMRRYMR